MGGDGVLQSVRRAASAAVEADRLGKARLFRLAQGGDRDALAALWERWRLHLPLAERRHGMPCVAGSCPDADRGLAMEGRR